ncbi:MAG: hypothetical protein RBR87_13320 [Bacteroidales bacterium]|jgi:hypothetical protein|nr:hypothetical protein [Bacteroidales bacterium]
MKIIFYIIMFAIILASCDTNKSELEEIQLEIPEVLMDNSEAKALIEDMTDAVNSIRTNMVEGVQFAAEQNKSGTDSLSFWQELKAGKMVIKMMLSTEKMEQVMEEALLLKPSLSEAEWLALNTKISELEAQVGDLNPEALGLSEEEIAKLKAEEALRIDAEGQGVDEEVIADKQELESAIALREMEKSQMLSDEINTGMQQSASDGQGIPSWLGLLFVIVVFGFIIFAKVARLKQVKRRFNNASSDFRNIKDQFNKS